MNLVKLSLIGATAFSLVACMPSEPEAYNKTVSERLIQNTVVLSQSVSFSSGISVPGIDFVAETSGLSTGADVAAASFRTAEDETEEDPFEIINSIIITYIQNAETNGTITSLGDVHTITLDPAKVCDSGAGTAEDLTAYNECVTHVSVISIVLTETNADSGTIAVNYNQFTPVVLTHTSSSVEYEFNLFAIKTVLEAVMDPAEQGELPGTFEGVLALKVEALSESEGQLSVFVREAISVDVDDGVDAFLINISADSSEAFPLFRMTGNEVADTGDIEVNLQGLSIAAPITADDGITVRNMSIAVPAFTGALHFEGNNTLTDVDDVLTATAQLGIFDESLTVNLDDAGTIAEALSIEHFILDVSMGGGVLRFKEAFDFFATIKNDSDADLTDNINLPFFAQDIDIAVNVEDETTLQEVADCANDEGVPSPGTKVISGSVDMTIDVSNGTSVVTKFVEGTCFTD